MPTSAQSANQTAAAFGGAWSGIFNIDTKYGNLPLCMEVYISVKDDRRAAVAVCRGSMKEYGRLPVCGPLREAEIRGDRLTFGNFTFSRVGQDRLAGETLSLVQNTPLFADFHREQ